MILHNPQQQENEKSNLVEKLKDFVALQKKKPKPKRSKKKRSYWQKLADNLKEPK